MILKVISFLRNQKMVMAFALLASMNAFSQSTIPPVNNLWLLHSEKDGVKFSYKVDVCNGDNVMLLKFENVQNFPKNVDFKLIIDGPVNDLPMPSIFHLGPNEVLTGQCLTPMLLKHIASTTPVIHLFTMNIIQ